MLIKRITFMGRPAAVGCDERCEKAWGIDQRPTVQLSEDDDEDFAWLADDELPVAPECPGTSEGGEGKPLPNEDKLNRWCVRQCERAEMTPPDGSLVRLPDFSRRRYNRVPHERED